MRKHVIAILSVACLAGCVVGCGQSSENYSSDLSKEVPKPKSDGPDFGAYKGNDKKPDGGPTGLKKGG